MLCSILESISSAFNSMTSSLGLDVIFFLVLAVEVLIIAFFMVRSLFSYEAKLNRSLEKINVWLFEKKTINENNIKELNEIFKTKMPSRVCYFWQQYILFREGSPSSYLSADNLIEKPLKTSSYDANVKNLSALSWIWAIFSALIVVAAGTLTTALYTRYVVEALVVAVLVAILGYIFVVYLRARKNSMLNSLYQNVSLFGRFMDNACVDLPTYIDYQILFTPEEIEKGQPVLREFLDSKARKEKEEFNKLKEQGVETEKYDFSSAGVNGSLVLERAMKESETYLKTKDKILVQISTYEGQLDTRKKNFDNVQKEYQSKMQASRENIDKLRQMQEETTNRIESNYYRKQQTQEVSKQEQLEQEFEQQRARYLLEKQEGEEEIEKLKNSLEESRKAVEEAMQSEYASFFDSFCKSAEKVVSKAFEDKFNSLEQEKLDAAQYSTSLELRLKNRPDNGEPASAEDVGQYDENGNYVYPNGSFYDPDGNFHDIEGNVWTQEGELVSKAEEVPEEKVVDLDDFDPFSFMTDISQRDNVYDVAENVIKTVEPQYEVINTSANAEDEKESAQSTENSEQPAAEKQENVEAEVKTEDGLADFTLDEVPAEKERAVVELDDFEFPEMTEVVPEEEPKVEEKETEDKTEETEKPQKEEEKEEPKKKAGRPRKIVNKTESEEKKKVGRPKKTEEKPAETKKKVGRPKKDVQVEEETKTETKRKPGRPKKVVEESQEEKRKVGRPRKTEQTEQPKRGRGRPKKEESLKQINEINQRLSEEEARLNELRASLNSDLEQAIKEIDNTETDKTSRREELIQQISRLQKEAEQVIRRHESEARISEINDKLEKLLEEVKKLY